MEPKMEDLLASIRKAIDNDLGGEAPSTKGQTRGTLMRGALREMRVSLDNHERTGTSPEKEIAELRGRISRSAKEAPPIPPPPRRQARPSLEPPRDDFRRIMGVPRPSRSPEVPPASPPPYLPEPPSFRATLPPPPDFRGTVPDEDLADINYQQQRYSPPAPPAYHNPYANTPYGYEEDLPPGAYQQAEPEPPPAYAQHSQLLSDRSEAAAVAAFRDLSEKLLARASGGRPIDELTTELLRGMLKQWLDDNLPSLVERLVRDEIQRVARRGR